MSRLLFLLLLVSCGGGGGGYTEPSVPSGPVRDSIYFTYYGSEQGQVEAVAAHTNMAMVMGWDGLDIAIAEMQQAQARGLSVMLELPEAYQSEAATRQKFTQLQALDLLRSIKAIYPIDEPDAVGLSAEKIAITNAMIRRVMTDFGINVPLAVIYSAKFTWPGIASYDWAGFDNYDADIFSNGDYARLKSMLRADQRILLVPGGADRWRQDPQPFINKANADPQVVGIVAFIYRNNADPQRGASLGIKSNGMKGAYCAAGRTAINRPGMC